MTAWGAVADGISSEEITKGSLVEVKGTLRSSTYDKDGDQITHIFISAFQVNLINQQDDEAILTTQDKLVIQS